MNHITGKNALIDQNIVIKKAQIGEGMKVADLGCGMHGFFVFPISKVVGKHGLVYAVDILKIALDNIQRTANQNNKVNVKTVWSDLEIFKGTNIMSGDLNVALLINTLHQSKKRIEIIREASRLLKKDGLLVVVEWNDSASPLGPTPENKVKVEALKDGLIKIGYKTEEQFEAGKYHYGIVFRKM
ncbi:class I SAM-dependent methyltransferase [Patescibacteria group bacterium]|nr:class I SAM-dependent methyltransferase [Patescibacteria group bacterium]